MQKILLFIDRISAFVGKTVSWLIVSLTLLITYEVFSRYALDAPHPWAFDAMIMMYGALFMMAGPPIYPFKTVIPVAGAFLLAQGIVEMIRCVICLKEGKWPSRQKDVEEVDVEELKEKLQVKDEDIEKLDAIITAREKDRK